MKNNILKLLSYGKLLSAIDFYESVGGDESILMLFTKDMFNYKDREALPDFLLPKIDLLNDESKPIVLANLLILSEMSGDIKNMRCALVELESLSTKETFNKILDENKNLSEIYFTTLMRLFLYDIALKYIKSIDNVSIKEKYLLKYNKVNNFYKEFGGVDSINNYINAIISNNKIKLSKKNIIFKLTPNIYKNIINESEDFYPVNILRELKKLTHFNIILAPQFSMPGPGFKHPYTSNNKLIIVDHHKYSDEILNKDLFIHLKMTHKRGYFLINNQGYSGWVKSIEREDVNYANKKEIDSFFIKYRERFIGSKLISNNGSILIPLQIQADSVQKLSKFSIVEMLNITLEYFKNSNKKIIITRHPKCKDVELTKTLESVLYNYKNVILSEEKTLDLLVECDFVILCNSSVGWDAILAEKPIISFGQSEYSEVVHKINNISDFYDLEFKDLNKFIKNYRSFFYSFWKVNVFPINNIARHIKNMISSLFDDSNIIDSYKVNGEVVYEKNTLAQCYYNGTNFIGDFTIIDPSVQLTNVIIGRYTVIEKNVAIGERDAIKKSFSNHPMTYLEQNIFPKSDFYSKIYTKKHFYESNKTTYIGHDVLIQRGVVIKEGVTVGNGAILLANSYIDEDVSDYEIVGGVPASSRGFRFDIGDRTKLLHSQWWFYDFSSILNKQKRKAKTENYDYRYSGLIDMAYLLSNKKKIEFDGFYFNSLQKVNRPMSWKKIIIGPSHVYIWKQLHLEGKSEIPQNSFLYPTNALSSFSMNLVNLIKWAANNFEEVIYFVPDFRIGNAALNSMDGKFISPHHMNSENDQISYRMALDILDDLSLYSNVKMLFWSLYGREFFNKKHKRHFTDKGVYLHPIWNYSEIQNRYKDNIINIDEDVFNFEIDVHHKTIHLNLGCYKKLKALIDNV